MKKLQWLLMVMGVMLLSTCSRVPMTGRKQMKLIPAGQMQAMSYSSYREFLNENPGSRNRQYQLIVSTCGNRISEAVENYMNKNKRYAKRIKGYSWEFNVVESEQINAWCMPGGKVVFYSSIMPICSTETGTAVVMGHEIAHAIAAHGNERMSQGLAASLGGITLAIALQSKPQETQDLFFRAYGIGSQVGVMLPFSRKHESEADKMGLMFMAMAGYDPRESIKFWERMEKANKAQRPPEFLATHPAPETRINNLRAWMPEALKYYYAYLNSH